MRGFLRKGGLKPEPRHQSSSNVESMNLQITSRICRSRIEHTTVLFGRAVQGMDGATPIGGSVDLSLRGGW